MINIGSKIFVGIENRVLLINGKILIVLYENFRNIFYSVLYFYLDFNIKRYIFLVNIVYCYFSGN